MDVCVRLCVRTCLCSCVPLLCRAPQVLTHIKEKLQFVAAQVEGQKRELEALDAQCAAERDTLTHAKRTRDVVRADNEKCVVAPPPWLA